MLTSYKGNQRRRKKGKNLRFQHTLLFMLCEKTSQEQGLGDTTEAWQGFGNDED